jgi:phage shock protein PspC (stress-responsive transcriptional regulator)
MFARYFTKNIVWASLAFVVSLLCKLPWPISLVLFVMLALMIRRRARLA